MKRISATALCIAAYASMSIFTYGHAMAHHPKVVRFEDGFESDATLITSFICAVAWPLYWSVELQR